MKIEHPPTKPPHLSVVSNANDNVATRLTRAEVAKRIGASTSTVRRYEGTLLHPQVEEDGTHTFDPKEVTALAAKRTNQALARGSIRNASATMPATDTRAPGEVAALVFERFEQRQSQAEIVIGLRVVPELVQQLFDQWCLGLTERQLRRRDPRVLREQDYEHVYPEELIARLAGLPEGEMTRISIGLWRGVEPAGDDKAEYARIVELGGFVVSGPCTPAEITNRFGRGTYRVTAYGFDPPGLRWEVIVVDLAA